MRKKLTSILLVLSLVLGSFGFVFGATFSDVSGFAGEEAVYRLADLNIISGYGDGTFKPANPVTRAEMATILVKALSEKVSEKAAPFSDTAGHWANGYISSAAELGLVGGYPDGTFGPQNNVTYNEAITMLIHALGYGDDCLEGTWPDKYLDQAAELGVEIMDVNLSSPANRGDIAILTEAIVDLPIGAAVDGVWTANEDGTDTIATRAEAALAALTMPDAVKELSDKVTALAKECADTLNGDYADKYAALLESGEGRDHSDYDDLRAVLDDFRVKSGAFYVYILTDMDPEDGYFEITVDGSEEPDDWMYQYGVEGQFLAAQAGTPAAAASAWDDGDSPVWSAFAPIYDSEDNVVGILGVDYPAPIILDYPEWNRDSDQWNGQEYEYEE